MERPPGAQRPPVVGGPRDVIRARTPSASLAEVLARAGFAVEVVATAAEARSRARTGGPARSHSGRDRQATGSGAIDGVVIDAEAEEAAGAEALGVIEELVASGDGPRILLLAAAAFVPDRVRAMRAGADDVVAKPVCHRELVARVVGLTAAPVSAPSPKLELGCLVVDGDRKEVRVDGARVVLSPLQYELLVALAEAGGEPVPGKELLARAWDPHQEVDGSHLRPQLARMRRALGDRCEITWVGEAGYVLRCQP